MKQNEVKLDWIAFFRIAIGLYAIVNVFSLWKDLPKILYEGAYIKPELVDVVMDNYSPTIYDIHLFINSYFYINYDTVVNALICIYLVALSMLILGLITRTSAIIAFLMQIIIFKSMHFYLYGADFFLSMALFYCVIFPKSKQSIDHLIFKIKQNPISMKWSLILLQSHICIIYFFSGLDKGLGINWYNGESIWRAISGHNYNGLIDLTQMEIPNFIFTFAGISTLIIEFFYPLFINVRITRKLWLCLTILMHISIALFMGLYLFAMIMIILNLSAYYFPYLHEENKPQFQSIKGIFNYSKKKVLN